MLDDELTLFNTTCYIIPANVNLVGITTLNDILNRIYTLDHFYALT